MASRLGSPNKNKQFLLKKLHDMYGKEFDPIMKMAEIAASMGTPEDINDAQKKQAVDAWEKIAQYVRLSVVSSQPTVHAN